MFNWKIKQCISNKTLLNNINFWGLLSGTVKFRCKASTVSSLFLNHWSKDGRFSTSISILRSSQVTASKSWYFPYEKTFMKDTKTIKWYLTNPQTSKQFHQDDLYNFPLKKFSNLRMVLLDILEVLSSETKY